jgi:hypothetical protein
MTEVNKFQPVGSTKVINGSILTPHHAGLRFVLNFNNMVGDSKGSPLFPVFNKKWPKVQQESRGWYQAKTGNYKMGTLAGVVAVQSDVWVVCMLVQDKDLKVDLVALQKCLKQVCKDAKADKASVHISTLLTDMTPELAEMAQKELVSQGVSVLYYNEPTSK